MAKNDDLMQRKPRCSFCGKTQDQVRRLIAGPNAYICDECITLCQEIMSDDLVMPENVKQDKIPSPSEMKAVLDDYVIGQEKAKRTLCVAVYNHYKRISAGKRSEGIELQKSNVLMVGPTGCGKTYLVQMLASSLGILAMIPPKMMSEIPLPIPFWSICSPMNIRKQVPAVSIKVITM